MRYTPLATDALCPMPYALCPREHLMLLRKPILSFSKDRKPLPQKALQALSQNKFLDNYKFPVLAEF